MYAKKGAFFYLLWFAFVTASPHHWRKGYYADRLTVL